MGLFDRFKKNSPPQEWVDLIFEENTLAETVSMNDLLRATEICVENCNRIMEDCIRIMKDTKDSDTFFERYKLFDDKLYFLTCLEPYCKFKDPSPSQLREKAILAREDTVEPFLRKQFNKTWDFIHGDSTNRAKINRAKKYMNMLEKYKPQIPDSVFYRYKRKCQNLIDELDQKNKLQANNNNLSTKNK